MFIICARRIRLQQVNERSLIYVCRNLDVMQWNIPANTGRLIVHETKANGRGQSRVSRLW